jgi:proline iminopeptidase
MVAMAYAIAHPDRLERLVLASTLAHAGEAQHEEAQRAIARRASEPWHAQAVAALEAEEHERYETADDLAELWKAMAPMYFAHWNEDAHVFIDETAEIGNADALRLFNAHIPDLLAELPQIRAEALVLAGAEDFVCGPASAREIGDAVPSAHVTILPDAGHFTYFEARDAFRAALLGFLASG